MTQLPPHSRRHPCPLTTLLRWREQEKWPHPRVPSSPAPKTFICQKNHVAKRTLLPPPWTGWRTDVRGTPSGYHTVDLAMEIKMLQTKQRKKLLARGCEGKCNKDNALKIFELTSRHNQQHCQLTKNKKPRHTSRLTII